MSEALEKIRTAIDKFTPQPSVIYVTEEAKVEYLYDDFIAQEWTSAVLPNFYAE